MQAIIAILREVEYSDSRKHLEGSLLRHSPAINRVFTTAFLSFKNSWKLPLSLNISSAGFESGGDVISFLQSADLFVGSLLLSPELRHEAFGVCLLPISSVKAWATTTIPSSKWSFHL